MRCIGEDLHFASADFSVLQFQTNTVTQCSLHMWEAGVEIPAGLTGQDCELGSDCSIYMPLYMQMLTKIILLF